MPARRSFEELQQSLVARLSDRGLSEVDSGTIVVVPSITFPSAELRKIIAIQHYEERLLCVLLMLDRPALRMVFVSSVVIDPVVVDYYLGFLRDPESARRRLELVAVGDPEPRALTSKLLDRNDLIAGIRQLAGEPDAAYILPFNVTDQEKELGERLGIAVYGPRPDLATFGGKSGSRRIAREAGVAVFEGAEDLTSIGDIEAALGELKVRRPAARTAVIKLNYGFSGQGNAIVDLTKPITPLPASGTVFCASEESWGSYEAKIQAEGGIVEELVRGPDVVSPSVQMRIPPAGSPELVSTHDQILGGLDDQVYLGCTFPANDSYRAAISERALAVAGILASKGVIGSFGVDFVVIPSGDGHDVYLSEINLRMGGTSHPFLMARYATGGSYDPDSGQLIAEGRPKFYMSTDNLKSKSFIGLDPGDVIAELEKRGLAYNPDKKTGTTVHLLGALREYGKLGVLCIADSREAAQDMYRDAVAAIEDLGAR